uniref:BMERB domain-containing protein n=1 Tax=Heligmosomoides polygyrus TaxID=6339 RepID=A0A183FQL5_HELPZ
LSDDGGVSLSDEEDLRARMDMHQLVAHGSIGGDSPPQTADQSCDFTGSMMTDRTMESVDSMYSSMRSPLPSGHSSEADMKLRQAQALAANPENLVKAILVPSTASLPFISLAVEKPVFCRQDSGASGRAASTLYLSFAWPRVHALATAMCSCSIPDLHELSYSKLVTLNAEMEQLIQVYNESLVDELAHRDELEYEKEMKNTFISLLLSIQNKRRQFVNERKRKGVRRVEFFPYFFIFLRAFLI